MGASLSDRLEVYFDIEGIGELTPWGAQPVALDVAVSTRAFSTAPSTLFSLAPNNDPPAAVLQGMNLDFDDLAHYPLLDMFNELVAGDTRDDQQKERLQRQLSYMLTDIVWYGHLLPVTGLAGAVHYLPAGRSGLLEAWTDVVRMRLEQEREGLALHGSDPPALGGIALDFLIELQRLTRPTHRRARFNPFAPRKPRATAPQTAVAEALVALTQSGVNVLCTTHSTEFLHQVSNCMLRAAAAVDCDECNAFAVTQIRPDVILTRECEEGHPEWVVMEMKLTMREHAGAQATAGLAILANHPLFALNISTARVVFVVKRRRRSDQRILRNIGTITAGPWSVGPVLRDSHARLPCVADTDPPTSDAGLPPVSARRNS